TKILELGTKLSQYSINGGAAPTGGKLGDLLTLAQLKNLADGNYLFSIPNATLNLAISQGMVKTLASPRIRILNKKKARFAISDRVPIAVSTTTVAQTTTTGSTPEYKEVGVKMDFIPIVHSEESEVTLEVKLEVSSLGEKVTLQADGKSTEAYTTRSRNAETFLRLKDGEKAVLAGLISNNERTSTSKVPFLGDIPLLGILFKSKSETSGETDILMSITPRIVRVIDVPPEVNKSIPSGKEESYMGSALSIRQFQPPSLPNAQNISEDENAAVPEHPVPQSAQ
ncbi:type II and III secretion system protein, partial [bacterium]